MPMIEKALVLTGLFIALALPQARGANGFTLLRVSTPLVASASAGLRLGPSNGTMRPSMQVEAGIGGGRIAIGLDNTGEARFGYGFKAALLQTWLAPIRVDEDQTFLGLEGELSIQKLILGIGGYRRVSEGDDDWLGSASLGFLF